MQLAPSADRCTTLLYGGGVEDDLGPARRMAVVLSDDLHAGLDGARAVLSALEAIEPDVCDRVAGSHPSECNTLFRGRFPDAPPMSLLSSTCSERRLHAECEQVFRILNMLAEAVVAAAARAPLTLVIRGAGYLDLPSLRGVVRIAERASGAGAPLTVALADMAAVPSGLSAHATAIRARMMSAFVKRLAASVTPGLPTALPSPSAMPACVERDRLVASSLGATPELRLSAALLAMRSAFFSTSYDVGVTAAERVLALLDEEPDLDLDAVRAGLAGAATGDDPASIGIGPDDVASPEDVRSLALRYLGMTDVFVLNYSDAERWFAQAIAAGDTAPARARARLLRALLRIKRVGKVEEGFQDVADGLADLAGDESEAAQVEAAWLHNVRALGYVQLRDAGAAMADEQSAIRLVGRLSSVDATHLKVNLVSNVSVLREYGRKVDAAVDVWRRFSARSDDWGDSFFVHHAYREGGLLVKAGKVAEGRELLASSYERAARTHDDFYRMLISLEVGVMLLDDGDMPAAQEWLARAVAHADRVGDPFHRTLAELAIALTHAPAGPEPEERERLSAFAERSFSYPEEAGRLGEALRDGDAEALRACLPAVRTKLNRPFKLVQLELLPA